MCDQKGIGYYQVQLIKQLSTFVIFARCPFCKEHLCYNLIDLWSCSALPYWYFPISGVSWWKASQWKNRSSFIDFCSSRRRMFWLSRNKWSGEDYYSIHAIRYLTNLYNANMLFLPSFHQYSVAPPLTFSSFRRCNLFHISFFHLI